MSLIQEALRRKDEESGGGPDRIPPRVVLPIGDTPAAVKSADVEPSQKKHAPIWGVLGVLLAVGLIGVLVVLGWFFYRFAPFLQAAKEPVTTPLGVESGGDRVALAMERMAPTMAPAATRGAPLTEAERPLPIVPEEKKTPVRTAMATDDTSARPLMPPGDAAVPPPVPPAWMPESPGEGKLASEKTVSSSTPEIEKRVGEKTSASVAEVKTVPVAVAARTSVWPRLTLNGVMAQTGPGQGSAIINGTVVEIGEKIEGVRLLEVQRNGVLLEYKGNTQFVRVGQSTY